MAQKPGVIRNYCPVCTRPFDDHDYRQAVAGSDKDFWRKIPVCPKQKATA